MFVKHLNTLPWALLLILLLTALMLQLAGASGAASAETESVSTESNEIIPREAIRKLDFSVRQALLRAIDKLEREEANAATTDDQQEHETTTLLPPRLTTLPSIREREEILEESTSSADVVVPTVQFYTATFDERNAQEQLLSSFIDRSKLWKKTIQLKQSSAEPTPVSLVATSAGDVEPDSRQLPRSVDSSVGSNEISHDTSDEIKFEIRNVKKATTVAIPTTTTTAATTTTTTTTFRPRTTRRRTTSTTTTTTTTTPRPTHNEDGENIELVDKQDIRIQEAPLVTAFTVDLDERGTARKVRPLHTFQEQQVAQVAQTLPHIGPTITKLSVLESELSPASLATQSPVSSSSTSFGTTTSTTTQISPIFLGSSSNTNSNYIKDPSLVAPPAAPIVNNYIIERQRALEQQIYQLKLQAQQQQALILHQLKLLEQQSQSRFQAAPIAQSSTLQPLQQQQQEQQEQQQQQQQQQLQHASLEAIQTLQPPTAGYSIRPSVEFIPSTHTKTIIYPTYPIEQQLPLRDAVAPHKFSLHGSSNSNSNNYQKLPAPANTVQQIFQNLQQNLQKTAERAAGNGQNPNSIVNGNSNSNIKINNNNHLQQQSVATNQFNFAPAETALLQALPQNNYQQFQQQQPQQQQLLLPSYVSNAVYQQQQHRARLFRQEAGTGNFGLNNNANVEIQPSNSFATTIVSQHNNNNNNNNNNNHINNNHINNNINQNLENQNFYRQHLTPQLSSQLQQNAQQYLQQQQQQQQLLQQQQQQQSAAVTTAGTTSASSALNHGIPQFASQNLHYNGAF